jgi:hypothetical protein
MWETLKGSALYVAGATVLAIIGAATYLAQSGVLSGQDWLTIVVPVLTGVVGVTSAHVAGTQVASAINTVPAQAPGVSITPPVPPVPAPTQGVTI